MYFIEKFKLQILLGYHKKHTNVYLKSLYYQIFIVFLCLMLKIYKYTQKYMSNSRKVNSCKTYFHISTRHDSRSFSQLFQKSNILNTLTNTPHQNKKAHFIIISMGAHYIYGYLTFIFYWKYFL